MPATTTYHDSPIGRFAITADDEALTALSLHATTEGPAPAAGSVAGAAAAQLDEYLAGDRADFDLPLAPRGTPFELEVWTALRAIPYGDRTTYGALAQELGRPSAARAVGRANGANPLCIVVPCHRVVGASGALTGFAYGLETKRALLDLEADAVIGVRTTKIYCRPDCTPPTRPLARNVRRYPNAAAARAAGLRACKLCRPQG